MIAHDWLDNEDKVCRDDRLRRLKWLAEHTPQLDLLVFPGGLMTKYLFEEARYSYAYGQFLATIMLGVAYMERVLAARFFGHGRDDLERAGCSQLLAEAREQGLLSEDEYSALDLARSLRNPVVHFRAPGPKDRIERRSLAEDELPYTVIERDAEHVITAMMRILSKPPF